MEKTYSKLFLFATISLIALSYNADAFTDADIFMEFLDDNYSYDDTAIIQVTDPAINMYSNAGVIDSIDISISSDADTVGTTITLHETDSSSDIFEGTIFFVLDDHTSGHRLQVVQGGEIYATYGETTISTKIEGTPSPITDTTELLETPAYSQTDTEDKKFTLSWIDQGTLYLHEESVSLNVILTNYDEELIDHTAHVWSDSDSEGYAITLSKHEFGNNLHGLIQFSSDSLDNKLKVKSGDSIFTKYGDSVTSIVVHEYISPLKQQESGIVSEEVVCKQDRANMQRPDGSAACIKFESTSHFAEKGWILMPGELFKGPTS